MSGFIRLLLPLFIGFSILSSAGCSPTKLTLGQSEAEVRQPVHTSILARADDAWRMGDMPAAERLYAQARMLMDLPASQYEVVFSRLNAAALANGHIDQALDAMRAWSIARPDAIKDVRWVRAWGATLLKVPEDTALPMAHTVTEDSITTAVFRAEAYGVLLVRGPQDEHSVIADNLGAVYITAEHAQKAQMERNLLQLVESMSADALVDVLQYTSVETDRSFPWSVLLLEKARREMKGVFDEDSVPTVKRIDGPGVFADLSLMREALRKPTQQAGTFTPIRSMVPLYPATTTLALPLTGNYASIGRQIAAGAEAARAELNRTGISTTVICIDTNDAGWTSKVAALPSDCVMVGGPVVPAAYAEAKKSGVLDGRVFFTFLTALDKGDEGRVAWRFFTAPRDQVSAVLRYASEVGVRTYASLYPDEGYGRRMNAIFLEMAPGSKASAVAHSVPYPPKDIAAWNDLIAGMLGTRMIGKVPSSSADFEAVYLPDSWDKASLLIPYLFFNGEDRLLILGSSLWGQGLEKGRKIDGSNVRTTVYPAAWNATEPTPAARNLMALLGEDMPASFWTGLGYDFVRFAAAMQGEPLNNARTVNRRLATASRINWSIAPFVWTDDGIASQRLFVLNPAPSGIKAIAPEKMADRLAAARERYDRRIQSATEKWLAEQQKEEEQTRADDQRRLEEGVSTARPTGDGNGSKQ